MLVNSTWNRSVLHWWNIYCSPMILSCDRVSLLMYCVVIVCCSLVGNYQQICWQSFHVLKCHLVEVQSWHILNPRLWPALWDVIFPYFSIFKSAVLDIQLFLLTSLIALIIWHLLVLVLHCVLPSVQIWPSLLQHLVYYAVYLGRHSSMAWNLSWHHLKCILMLLI